MADFEVPDELYYNDHASAPSSAGPHKKPQINPTAKPDQPPPPEYMRDTLHESVGITLWRDLKLILLRTWQVMWIFNRSPNLEVYEYYDVFGPLFYILVFSISIQFSFQDTTDAIMAILIAVIIAFSFIIAVNLLLLGGNVSIMGTVCLMGYSIAPMAFAALIEMLLELFYVPSNWIFILIMSLVAGATAFWSLFAVYGFFKNVSVEYKVFYSVYPVFFLFIALGLFIVISAIN